jgi:hypothetical protein
MPIDSYRSFIERPEPEDMLYLIANGKTYPVRDFTKFADSTSFAKVIGSLYSNAGSDYQFLYELWFITSKMTAYSEDIGEDPRWALETLTEAGGDCEDLTILIASMLKAAPQTKNWTIQMVYLDLDNPEKPMDVDHVALFVKTGSFQTFVESTAKTNGLNSLESVNGWYYTL